MRSGIVRQAAWGWVWRCGLLVAPVLASSLIAGDARATAPSAFTVQGVLRNNAGALQSLAISVTVALYSAQSGGTPFATVPSSGSYATC